MAKIMMRSTQEMSIKEAYEKFVRFCKIRNLSEQTIKTYTVHYDIYSTYQDIEEPLSVITKDNVDDYIIYLQNTNIKAVTINSYLRTLKAFLYWCMNNGYLSQFKMTMLRTDKDIKETYSETELRILLKKPDVKNCSFTEFKIWAFSNFLLGTGMRISSAINIKIKDIDFQNNMITMNKAKNRKAQFIPLSRSLYVILQEYISVRGNEPEDYLFCRDDGTKAAIATYQTELRQYNHNRGIMKTSAHLYRHTFAKQWILAGGDIFRLQKILGHSDLQVVKEYVNMFSNEIGIDFDKFNPLDNLNGVNKEKIKMR